MYADDTNVTSSAATLPDLESQINGDILIAGSTLISFVKTEFMVISSRQKLQSLNDYKMNIHINQSNPSKSLTLTMDENLSWKYHVHEISKKSIL